MKKIILLISISLFMTTTNYAQKNKKKFQYIDKTNMDIQVKPGDNFFEYSNNKWVEKNPVPASKTRWGNFDILAQTNAERLRELAEEASRTSGDPLVAGRVGNFYASFMDSATLEEKGFSPIQNELETIAGLRTKHDVLKQIALLRTHGLASPLFGMFIYQDRKNVTQYIPNLSQGGTSLPDRDYYLKDDSRSKQIRGAYLDYMKDMFQYIGNDANTAQQKAQSILDLETALAKIQWSRVEMRNPQKTYNKYSLQDFNTLTPGFNWKELFTDMQIQKVDSIVVNNPDFFKAIDVIFTAVPLNVWKSYLEWNILKGAAPYLSKQFVERNFQFDRVLTGQKELAPRWQRGSELTDRMLGELIGQLYVKKYFNEAAKQRMLALVNNIQETFGSRIKRLDWMSEETKQQALKKLNAIVNKIGFPDKWKTYDGVEIYKDQLFNNIISINKYRYNEMINKIGKPVDKTEWGMTPPTINAYYSPINNEIVFPAGILQFPFFDFGADDAVNYGGIAAVIGHELTHGFDDQGRQYAADGNLQNWWTDADAEKFDALAQKVINQYNGYTVNDSIHVNGKLTLGENLADLGGLAIAYEAFKHTPQGQGDKKIDGFTPDQRFFLSWAQVWRNSILPEAAAQRILTDPHSPSPARVNGPVSNMDEWYKAFDVKPSDKMYKPESERIKIW